MDVPRPGIVRRIYANLGMLVSGKAVAGLLSLAYLVIAARSLGPADYGILILVHTYVLTVGGIVAFPGWHAIVRFGSHARSTGDTARLLRLLRFAGLIELAGGTLAIATAAVLAPVIGPRLGWSPQAQALALPYSLAVLAAIRATPAGYLQLMGRFDLIGMHNVVAPVVRLAGAAIAALLGAKLPGFLAVWLAAAIAEWAVMWLLGLAVARRHLGTIRIVGFTRGVVTENPGIVRFMCAANADITFGELAGRIGPLVIGWVLGPAAAGLYAIAQRITVVFQQPAQILGQAAYAEFTRLAAAGNGGARLRRALTTSIAIAAGVALPVVVAMTVWARPLVELAAGEAFAGAAAIIGWLAVARATLLAAPPASAALTALGRPGLSVAANMGTSLLLLPLLPILLWRYGLPGAGLQMVLQAIAATALLTAFVWRASGQAAREAMA